jgi:hypothetical protein
MVGIREEYVKKIVQLLKNIDIEVVRMYYRRLKMHADGLDGKRKRHDQKRSQKD